MKRNGAIKIRYFYLTLLTLYSRKFLDNNNFGDSLTRTISNIKIGRATKSD